MGVKENQNKLVEKFKEAGLDIDELRSEVAIRANKAYIGMWFNAGMVGARSSLSAAGLDNASAIEQIGYLFDKCPNENKFEHMKAVPFAYLAYCMVNGKLPPEEEWLLGLMKRIRKKHGDGLIFEMLNFLLAAPA